MKMQTGGIGQLADLQQAIEPAVGIGQDARRFTTDPLGIRQAPHPQGQGGPYRRWGKRGIDLALVLFTAPVWIALIAVIAFLTLIDGGSPFYSQPRVGRSGRVFRMWKIRSMVRNADRLLADHLAGDPRARDEWDRMQKLSNDPRVTRLGCFIRKTSLDELPQLWNVLRGDMSLVGPRPILVDQRDRYQSCAYDRLLPGLTGPWQVSSRNSASFAERAGFDAEYEATLSAKEDARLILRTFLVVFRATGK